MVSKVHCRVVHFQPDNNRLELSLTPFDMDCFPIVCQQLLVLWSATLKEKQFDADLHSWLIRAEGHDCIIRAEHYTQSVWIETLSEKEDGRDGRRCRQERMETDGIL